MVELSRRAGGPTRSLVRMVFEHSRGRLGSASVRGDLWLQRVLGSKVRTKSDRYLNSANSASCSKSKNGSHPASPSPIPAKGRRCKTPLDYAIAAGFHSLAQVLLSFGTIRNVLTHPMYAGAYVYGRTCQNPTTRRVRDLPQRLPHDQWQVLLKDRYPAYIAWEQFERNVVQLAEKPVCEGGVSRDSLYELC